MSSALSYQRVREHLEILKMEAALVALDGVLEQGHKQEQTAVEILDALLERERTYRFERRVATNLRLSALLTSKTLEAFD